MEEVGDEDEDEEEEEEEEEPSADAALTASAALCTGVSAIHLDRGAPSTSAPSAPAAASCTRREGSYRRVVSMEGVKGVGWVPWTWGRYRSQRESTARGGNKVGTLLRLDNRQNLARRRALGPARGFRCFRARHHCRRRKVCRGCNVNRELPKFTEVSALVYLLFTTHYLDDF